MVNSLAKQPVIGHHWQARARAHHSSKIMDKTSFVKKFLDNAGSSIVSVRFVKLDGSLRSVQFNPRDRQEIKGTGSPTTKANIIRCRDFRQAKAGNAAWRSFDTERVISIQANGQHIVF
jgi:hypothetical protein